VRDRVAPTLMWGRVAPGFGSRVEIANYYSLLQPGADVRATATVDLISDDGVWVAGHSTELEPRQQVHLDLSELTDAFEGTIAVRLNPAALPDHPHRYLGTLYFVTWHDDRGHVQFSHEQNRMTFEVENERNFLSPGIELRPELEVDVIVQSNYFGPRPPTHQDASITALSAQGERLGNTTATIPAGGSRRVPLASLAPGHEGTVSVEVEGANLNHPFTFIRHVSGDFNIHHF